MGSTNISHKNNILSISPLDGRYFDKLGDLSRVVSEFGLTKFRIKVEIEWFKFMFSIQETNLPELSKENIKFLDLIFINFDENECLQIKQTEAKTNHDVKAVEYYIKGKLMQSDILSKYKEFIHFACTSEDINNLSYALMLKEIKEQFLLPKLTELVDKIICFANEYRFVSMVSKTHGQPATPSTMGKELYNVAYRLQRQLKQLANQEILGKINGAVGNYNAHVVSYPNVRWEKQAKIFVEDRLGLTFNPFTTQIEPHDFMAELFDNIKRINTILIDFSRDIWSYISINYFKQKVISSEVGSSTMPHKVNPIDFENAEGNLGISNSLLSHMSEKLPISRYQRDLTDSTVQRNIGVTVGHSLLAYGSLLKGLNKLEINVESINADLDNNWELLAEPIQMIMRKYGIDNAYEQLKELTRGKKINYASLADFIKGLSIPEVDKKLLLDLAPESYIGLATTLF